MQFHERHQGKLLAESFLLFPHPHHNRLIYIAYGSKHRGIAAMSLGTSKNKAKDYYGCNCATGLKGRLGGAASPVCI